MSASGTTGERFLSIDAVRGFAVLGILLMNIVGMGMPAFAYLDPVYWGGHTGADLWTWAVNNVLTDGKMRGLFTILFGASTVLIADRAAQSGEGPIRTHYSRMFWLFWFGMLHAYFLWWGDILVCYAVAGLFVFPFRKLRPWILILIGAAVLAALIAFGLFQAGQIEALRNAALRPGASAATVKMWGDVRLLVDPPPSMAHDEIAGFGGGFLSALKARALLAQVMQLEYLPSDALGEAFAQMLIGMALFRLGFFTLRWSTRGYVIMMAVGYGVGVPLTAWLAWRIAASGFDPIVLNRLEVWQAAPRPLIALAHASALLLLVRSGALTGLVQRFAAAGRMAFSNYLMTSVITTLVFCGFGLGLYAQLSRFQQLAVVAGVWAFIMLWSKPWLARFYYGPFEWAWRSLVKLKAQPFVRPRPALAPAPA
jgi:uncharacterized protein